MEREKKKGLPFKTVGKVSEKSTEDSIHFT